MPLQFARTKPLQALKLGSVVVLLVLGVAGFVGLFDRGLDALLLVAFVPMLLALVVAGEALLAAVRLARADDPGARLADRPAYTAIRVVEVVVAVVAPATFYVLVVRIGDEVAGPGAIGLLLYGVALGAAALGAVLLRTLVEYYVHRRERSSATRVDRPRETAE